MFSVKATRVLPASGDFEKKGTGTATATTARRGPDNPSPRCVENQLAAEKKEWEQRVRDGERKAMDRLEQLKKLRASK